MNQEFAISDAEIPPGHSNDEEAGCSTPQAAEPATGTTILDLNEHCWWAILDYVDVDDIVRSERVCRKWQAIVHSYFQEVSICFVPISFFFRQLNIRLQKKNRAFAIDFLGIFKQPEIEHVLMFLDKWGPYMVYAFCPAPKVFERIIECCPKLKCLSISMNNFRRGILSQVQAEFVERLERIVFIDHTIHDHLEKIFHFDIERYEHIYKFRDIEMSTGFWPNFRPTHLKALTIRGMFDFRYFLSSVDCYPELDELCLQGNLDNVHLLFEKMPKLERLLMMQWRMNDERPTSICRSLEGLKTLDHLIMWCCDVRSWWLEGLVRGCRLRILDLRNTEVTTSVPTICRDVGRTLTEVRISDAYGLRDNDVLTFIKECPNLKALDVSCCPELSTRLLMDVSRAARYRAEPLLIRVGGPKPGLRHWQHQKFQSPYPGLIVDADYVRHEALHLRLRPPQYILGVMDTN